ncbi:hypothetical protein BSA16_02860 [Micromonospora sp. Rc5]|nr:hypothetical protein BSA16_02860 [Micromonospora sp. Rc5]
MADDRAARRGCNHLMILRPPQALVSLTANGDGTATQASHWGMLRTRRLQRYTSRQTKLTRLPGEADSASHSE